MSDKAILDENHNVVEVDDLIEWATWYEDHEKRRVADEKVGDVRISTVFLGLDHNHYQPGPPQWFETMVFGGPSDLAQDRYATWNEAVDGHAAMVAAVRERQATMEAGKC